MLVIENAAQEGGEYKSGWFEDTSMVSGGSNPFRPYGCRLKADVEASIRSSPEGTAAQPVRFRVG
jgi:hypothetical protein